MEVHFTPELQARLAQAAADNHSNVNEYLQQLVESYLDHDQWVRAKVQRGLDQLDRGESLPHADVRAHIDKLLHS
jgi:predicted transcriptional regulator